MLELHLKRTADQLTLTLGEHSASIPLAEVVTGASNWQRIYDDAVAYGRDLFDKTFRQEELRRQLTVLAAHERLLLVAEDPLVAAIPWEYLRDGNNKLLASRLNLVRGIPQQWRRMPFEFLAPLEIVAIPVSPVDEARPLHVEGEWKNLVEAVTITRPSKSLTLKRVRPPTRSQLERSLGRTCTSIVHFMGHSTSLDGRAFLAFEDARARSHLVDAADFADSLNDRVFLVVLNSCLSAVVAPTEFGNIAQALAQRGVPYALGMQFILPDDAALVLSDALYDFLLQEHSVEEAVMRTRRALEEPGKLPGLPAAWLAGIPVLYTSLREPAPAIELATEQPDIQPDPVHLEQICDLTALPHVPHFVGRGDQISEGLRILLNPHQRGFVLLYGLGGIGKTSLARALAQRVSWHYGDRVLAYSFEIFARLDAQNQRVIDETFADRFYNRLARFYGLDPTDAARYPTTVALQQAIRQRRMHTRSLLVFDNIETLIDTQKHHPAAQTLATFISQLKEGEGAILLTSRMLPPADWGDCTVLPLSGLSEEAGAALFLALLSADREHLAPFTARQALSRRVQGHPLSIRLLASRFAEETAADLATFLTNIEAELEAAEQATPASAEDPERQKTLYACLDYSIKRLAPSQVSVLQALGLFQAPFPPEFAQQVVADEQTSLYLQTLTRLSLLEISASTRTFEKGELVLLELHPMVRWYIQHHMPELDGTLGERYGELYATLTRQAFADYDNNARLRYLMRQSLPDCEAALQYLSPAGRSSLAYHLAFPYRRLGQNRHALDLYERSLEIDQELGDIRGVAVTQSAMADVLSQQGKPQEAIALYEQSLHTSQELGDIREVAVTQSAMADVLSQQGKPQEAIALYEQSLHTSQELGDIREVAVTQANYCQLLLQQGEHRRALMMAWQAYTSLYQHGYARDAQMIQQLLTAIKGQVFDPEQFNHLWAQVFNAPQPDWLLTIEAASQEEDQSHISPAQLEVIIANTISVMTEMPEKREEWREAMEGAFHQAQRIERIQDAEFFATILAILDEQTPSLSEDHPYRADLEKIQAGIAVDGSQKEHVSFAVSEEVMQAVQDFVDAENWDATRQAVETQRALLFRPEVETLFERNIAEARADGQERAVRLLEMHLTLLRGCKASSIEEAFAKLVAAEEEEIEETLPFDADLISRSIVALLGSPQEKMAYMQYLASTANETTDEELKALLNTIQLALFSSDLSQLGRNLQNVYRQAWETIAASVEAGGVDPEILGKIVDNTLAVLGPAASQHTVWRSNLAQIRNQATARGDRNMVALLDAVIGLLDAGGNPIGLGEGLQGIYAKTWQAIVQRLSA